MNSVDPLTKEELADIKEYLLAEDRIRDYALLTLGVNWALRISDIIGRRGDNPTEPIRVKDVVKEDGTIKNTFKIKEDKTDKTNELVINDSCKEALEKLFDKYPVLKTCKECALIFNLKDKMKSISRVQAYRLINEWCSVIGVGDKKVGTHTFRKSWATMALNEGYHIELIREKLNHSSQEITQRYLGLTQKRINDMCNDLNL